VDKSGLREVRRTEWMPLLANSPMCLHPASFSFGKKWTPETQTIWASYPFNIFVCPTRRVVVGICSAAVRAVFIDAVEEGVANPDSLVKIPPRRGLRHKCSLLGRLGMIDGHRKRAFSRGAKQVLITMEKKPLAPASLFFREQWFFSFHRPPKLEPFAPFLRWLFSGPRSPGGPRKPRRVAAKRDPRSNPPTRPYPGL